MNSVSSSGSGYKSFYSIDAVKRYAKSIGSHFFDADTMRFFHSRILNGVYAHGDHVNLFVTSERYDSRTPRFYTVRQLTETGVETVSGFQQFKSADAARRAIKSGRLFAVEAQ